MLNKQFAEYIDIDVPNAVPLSFRAFYGDKNLEITQYIIEATGNYSDFKESGLSLVSGEIKLVNSVFDYDDITDFKRGETIKIYSLIENELTPLPIIGEVIILQVNDTYDGNFVTITVGCRLGYYNSMTARDLAICVEFTKKFLIISAIRELLERIGFDKKEIDISFDQKPGEETYLYESLLVGNDTSIVQLIGKLAWESGYYLFVDNGKVKANKIIDYSTVSAFRSWDFFTIEKVGRFELVPKLIVVTGPFSDIRIPPLSDNYTIERKSYVVPQGIPGVVAEAGTLITTVSTIIDKENRVITTTESVQIEFENGLAVSPFVQQKITTSKYEPKISQILVHDDIYRCIPSDEGRLLKKTVVDYVSHGLANVEAIDVVQNCINIWNEASEPSKQYLFYDIYTPINKSIEEETYTYNFRGQDDVIRNTGKVEVLVPETQYESTLEYIDFKTFDLTAPTGKKVTYNKKVTDLLGNVASYLYHFSMGDDDLIEEYPDTFHTYFPPLISYIESENVTVDYSERMYGVWNSKSLTNQPMCIASSSQIDSERKKNRNYHIDDPQYEASDETHALNHWLYLASIWNVHDSMGTTETAYKDVDNPPDNRYPGDFEVVTKPFESHFWGNPTVEDLTASPFKGRTNTYSLEYGNIYSAGIIGEFNLRDTWGRPEALNVTFPLVVSDKENRLEFPNQLVWIIDYGVFMLNNFTIALDRKDLVCSANLILLFLDNNRENFDPLSGPEL